MNFKIFTTVIQLEFTSRDTIVLGKEAQDKLTEFEDEINTFISKKVNATIQWYQSTASVLELLIEAKAIPFTQFTAIIYW